jgi:hypothetical protein
MPWISPFLVSAAMIYRIVVGICVGLSVLSIVLYPFFRESNGALSVSVLVFSWSGISAASYWKRTLSSRYEGGR